MTAKKQEEDRLEYLISRKPEYSAVRSKVRIVCEGAVISVLFCIALSARFFGQHQQDIVMIDGDLKNPEINHPEIAQTVSTIALFISVCVSLVILLCWRFADPNREKRLFGVVVMFREICWSGGLAWAITNCAKVYVGRPRPNFFDYCEWEDDTGCTGDEADDAYRSFPSGHASMAMATFGLICMHFVENVILQLRGYQVPLMRMDDSTYGWCWNIFLPISTKIEQPAIIIALIPGFFAIFVICSRIRDYMHFAGDVVAGGLIGGLCALLAFSMFRKKTEKRDIQDNDQLE